MNNAYFSSNNQWCKFYELIEESGAKTVYPGETAFLGKCLKYLALGHNMKRPLRYLHIGVYVVSKFKSLFYQYF